MTDDLYPANEPSDWNYETVIRESFEANKRARLRPTIGASIVSRLNVGSDSGGFGVPVTGLPINQINPLYVHTLHQRLRGFSEAIMRWDAAQLVRPPGNGIFEIDGIAMMEDLYDALPNCFVFASHVNLPPPSRRRVPVQNGDAYGPNVVVFPGPYDHGDIPQTPAVLASIRLHTAAYGSPTPVDSVRCSSTGRALQLGKGDAVLSRFCVEPTLSGPHKLDAVTALLAHVAGACKAWEIKRLFTAATPDRISQYSKIMGFDLHPDVDAYPLYPTGISSLLSVELNSPAFKRAASVLAASRGRMGKFTP